MRICKFLIRQHTTAYKGILKPMLITWGKNKIGLSITRKPLPPGIDNVYVPLVTVIQEHDLSQALPNYTVTDLYLFVSDYQWLLRESEMEDEDQSELSERMAELYSKKEVRRVLKSLRRANWISQMILEQERAQFSGQGAVGPDPSRGGHLPQPAWQIRQFARTYLRPSLLPGPRAAG